MDTDKTVTTEEVVEQPAQQEPAAPAATENAGAPKQEARYERRPQRPGNNRRKKKVCIFCEDKIQYIDYKDTVRLRKFVSERGKILPRRISGACAKHQRQLTTAIKRARVVALMPYISD
ncbi:30S ribosomal protein S18 [Clostridiales bacterium]|nr:30S ribosomal protein S18 [Clostridiales bacterium]GFI55367.1 30S ribosomal protein S18 [Clostridiales bacterium]